MGITWAVVALFVAMSGYISYYALAHEQEMAENSYNDIQQILMEQNYRGRIYAAGGEVLAETVVAGDGAETRVYPYENLFAHVVGYATHGRTGIEADANYYLTRSNITIPQKAQNGADGVKNAGDSIYTTLRVDLQQTASKALGVYKGAVIVSEVKTGRILAMVSKPDFSPAEIPLIWDGLLADENSSVLLNRATQGLYPPGSTFKIVTALEYIRENDLDISRYRFNCQGHYTANGVRINCYGGIAHGQEDFAYSFAKSCNSSFANIGASLARESFARTLDELMFGKDLPAPLVYNRSSIELNNETTGAELMQVTIGQGKTQMTPFHLHILTAAIANGGILQDSQLYKAVKNENGTTVKAYSNGAGKQIMSAEETTVLRGLMADVVQYGTGTKLKEAANYTAAGKTGSAEYGNVKGESHAWFTGFAPADDPQLCVTVIIEGAGSGGDYAVPIAKRVFDAYFKP
ncbi:MAG: penicillin-binding protein 2 [Lachnospiraceae bacterium]|jgi:peptidoglycan glycosyltransferase|nr:penicillin-binding protein 2 [Lachnospiraceae bacterium]